MATRVNTKFVIILVFSLMVVSAGAIATFVLVAKKTGDDYIKLGDEAAARGDWDEAQRLYGSAVFKDQTNPVWMQLWFDALSQVVPVDRNEYAERFDEYAQAIERLARINRGDFVGAERYLGLLHDQHWLLYGAPQVFADQLAQESDQILTFFESSADSSWNRLRRYKGMGYVRILNAGGVLQADDRAVAITELRAAIEADPTDAEAATGLIQLLESDARQLVLAGNDRDARARWLETDGVLASLRTAAPNDYFTRMFEIVVPVGRLRLLPEIRALPGPTAQAEIRVRSQESIERFRSLLDEMAADDEPIHMDLVARARTLEVQLDPITQGRRTSTLITSQLAVAEARADGELSKGRLLRAGAELLAGQGRYEEAIAFLDELEELPMLALSIEGRVRLAIQRSAPALTARIAGVWASTLDDDPQGRENALRITSDARSRFRLVGGDESEQLLLIDAIVAEVLGDFPDALDNYARYNEATLDADLLAVRREALVAAQLGRFAQARRKFERILTRNEFDSATLQALGRVELAEGTPENLSRARVLFSRARDVEPDAEERRLIDQQITRLSERLGEAEAEDPVLGIIFEAARIADGSDGRVGDPVEAARILKNGLQIHDYDPRLVAALANRLITQADGLDEIKDLIQMANARRPNEPAIERLLPVLEAEEAADAVILVLEQSSTDEFRKLLLTYQIYTSSGRTEDADRAIAELTEKYPETPEVIELRFLRALSAAGQAERDEDETLRAQSLALAGELAAQAADIDADNVDGMTFEARLASARGDDQRAVDLLSAATRAASVDSAVWLLLARAQQRLGQIDQSIESLEQALSVRENDANVIFEYIQALLLANRPQDALTEARRLLPFADQNERFMALYLNIESSLGGREGLKEVIARRSQRLATTPEDGENALQLASAYVRDGQLGEAEDILTLLRERRETLQLVVLQASIYAVQGAVETPAGPRRGIDMARGAFIDYIIGLQSEQDISEAYQTMARFMYSRNQNEIALRAIEEARAIQDTTTRDADKLAGDILASLQRHDEAAEAYALVVNNGADDDDLTYRTRMIDALNRGRRYDDAIAELDKAGIEESLGVTGLTQRADALMGLGQRQQAIAALDSALNLNPEDPLIYLRRAEILASDPAYTRDTLDDVDEAIRLAPNDWRGHRLRAAVLTRLDRRNEAIRSLREVVRLNPRLNDAVVGLMSELIVDGRDGEALDVILEVLGDRPGDNLLILAGAQVFVDRGLWSRAASLYETAWNQTNDVSVGLRYIDALINTTPARPDDAQAVVEQMRDTGIDVDGISEILISQSLIERARGRPRRAESLIAQAFDALSLDSSSVLNWSGNVGRLFRDDQPGASSAFIDRLLAEARSPERQTWLRLVRAGLLLEDTPESPEGFAMMEAIAAQTEFPSASLLASRSLAITFYGSGRTDDAVRIWTSLLERFGDEWETANNLGYAIAIDQGRPEEGLPYIERALILNPDAALIANSLARVLIELERFDDAEDMLDRSQAMTGDIGARVTTQIHRARLEIGRGDNVEAERLLRVAEAAIGQMRGDTSSFAEEIRQLRSQIQGG